MGIKKIITIILIMVSLLIAALLIVINANFFKEISYVSPESKEKPAAEEEPELNYAITSTVIPTGQITETVINGIIEKRKAPIKKLIILSRNFISPPILALASQSLCLFAGIAFQNLSLFSAYLIT